MNSFQSGKVFAGLLALLSTVLCGPDRSAGQATGINSVDTMPNVLFIAVDDLRPELKCYGVEYAQSPHLDRFAQQSVLFQNHFVQVPTCGASRYALLTGRSPANSRAFGNAAFYQGPTQLARESAAGAQTFPELFRRNGYRTVCIGKISHTADGKVFAYNGSGDGREEVPNAWDELATPYGTWKRGWGTFFAYHGGRHREDGNGHRDLMEFIADTDDELPDGLMASAAIRKLDELSESRDRTGQPFLLGLGFFKPHLPWVATRQDWQALQDVRIPIASAQQKVASIGWHRSGEFYKYAMTFEKNRPLNEADQVTCRRAYLACVRYVDRQIGRVLQRLSELDRDRDTIVVIWGDHGWHLGETQIWGKHSPFDRALRSVLMMRVPGVSQAGYQAQQLVESIDLYPSLIDLCSLSDSNTAHTLDGHSLRAILAGGDQPVRSTSVSFFGKGMTARSNTHRLVLGSKEIPANDKDLWLISDRELYKLTTSADPTANVIEQDEEALQEIVQDLYRKKQ